MADFGDALLYWGEVFCIAFANTGRAVRDHLVRTIGGFVAIVIACIILGLLRGEQQATAKAEWWWISAAAGFLVMPFVFLYQLFIAPSKLQTEARRESQALGKKLDMEIADLKTTVKAQTGDIEGLKQAAERARTADPKRNAM